MRPMRLSLEGFTCFRQRQEPLDLSGLDLFAISGPTGSGKSSLLDAMIFALFGKVPRLRQGLSELISLGAQRAAVRFDFALADRNFRVYRALHRSRSTSAQLEELVDGVYSSLSEGVRETDRQVQGLLGLDYETFIRAVILPQGDFAAFLKSSPAKQREMLRRLLRLDVYEDMRALARREGQRLATRLTETERRLAEDYDDVTADHVESVRQQLEAAGRQLVDDTAALRRCRNDVESLRQRRRSWEEWETLSSRRRQLSDQRAAMDADGQRLAAARRVEPLLPRLEQLRELETQVHELETASKAAQEASTAGAAQHRKALDALQAARDDAAEKVALEAKGRQLDRLLGLFEPRRKALQQLEELAARQVAKWAKQQAVDRQKQQTAQRLQEISDEESTLNAGLTELAYDAELDARLDGHRETAVQLRHLRHEGLELGRRADAARRAHSEAQTEHGAAVQEEREVRQDLERTEAAYDEAVSAQRQAEQERQAESLRRRLTTGDPCPVCGREVDAPPPASADDEALETLAERRAALESQRRDERRRLAEAERRLAAAESTATTRREAFESARKQAVASAETVGRLAAELQVVLAEDAPGDPQGAVEERLLSAVEELAEHREQHRRMEQQQRRLGYRIAEVERQVERFDVESEALDEQLADLDGRLAATRLEAETLQEQLAELGPVDDPQSLRRDIDRQLEALRQRLEKAQDEERRQAVLAASTEQRHEAAEAAHRQAAERLAELHGDIAERLDSAGFETPAAARAVALGAAARQDLELALERFRQDHDAVERRLEALRPSLGDTAVTPSDVEAEAARQLQLEAAEQQQRDHVAALTVNLEDLSRRRERRRQLEEELAELRRAHGAYNELQRELAGQRFQAFLLERVFHDLVRGGTLRLMELSQQRYELAFEDGAFVVVDHDNAGQRRSADTLSGGETFLASLALALELCEQVQREAGAITLESLFIDEGFGTLDPETLETVAGAIEALPHGGRMVGIITHLPELTQRLPWRVMVTRHPSGSTYRIEEG